MKIRNSVDDSPVNSGYYQLPYVLDKGIILTDEKYNKLYFFDENMNIPEVLIDKEADYRSINISYDRKRIGLLLSEQSGEKVPAVYWVQERKLELLDSGATGIAEVSFAKQNISCYSKDSIIYILAPEDTFQFNTKMDVSKVRISPDAGHVAVCARNGRLYMLCLDSMKLDLITCEGMGFDPVWSPDGQKIVYSGGLDLIVWDKRCNEKFNLGQGLSPNWSISSEYVVYQKNIPIRMKFVNADIFVSKYNGSVQYQLTDTDDRYEMQPVFGFKNDLYYMTYEGRRLVHAKLNNLEFKVMEQQVLLEFQ